MRVARVPAQATPPIGTVLEPDLEIRRRQMPGPAPRPLDEQDRIGTHVITDTDEFEFFRITQTIEIEVIQRATAERVRLHQRVGRALHRAMMPERWRKGAITGSRAVDKSIRTVVTGGTVQVLWKFARAPLDELKRKVPQMVSGLGEAASEHAGLFERVQRGDTRYRDFLQDLIQDERDLARSTAQLAKDRTLPDLLKQIAERARTEEPPLIEDMLAGDVEGWPRETLLFVLQTWLHVGLLHVLRAFEVLESDAEYGGKFRLATLLEIAGLDVSLDDDTARELAVTFERS